VGSVSVTVHTSQQAATGSARWLPVQQELTTAVSHAQY